MNSSVQPVRVQRGRGVNLRRMLVPLAALVLVYCLVLASDHPWDIAIGAAIAIGVLFLFGQFRSASAESTVPSVTRRVLAFPVFAAVVVYEITRSTLLVASIVVGLRPLRRPGIVAVPIGERSDTGVAVSALVNALSPGSILVDVDWTKRVMLIHVIDASDPDQIRADIERLYQRYQRHVFP